MLACVENVRDLIMQLSVSAMPPPAPLDAVNKQAKGLVAADVAAMQKDNENNAETINSGMCLNQTVRVQYAIFASQRRRQL